MLSLPKPFTIVLYSLTYFPKTQLAELALKQGIIKEENIEGNADKCINQIHISPEYKRQPLEVFYVNLLYLTQIRFMPKFFVKFLSKAKTLKKYPRILEKFDFIVDKINRFFYQIIPLFYRGIGHLFCGRLNIAKLRSGIKSFEFIVGQKENF
jgi:hypothetical protein